MCVRTTLDEICILTTGAQGPTCSANAKPLSVCGPGCKGIEVSHMQCGSHPAYRVTTALRMAGMPSLSAACVVPCRSSYSQTLIAMPENRCLSWS